MDPFHINKDAKSESKLYKDAKSATLDAKSEFGRTRSGREDVRYAARSLTALASQSSVSIFEQSIGSTCEQGSMQHHFSLEMRGVNYPGFRWQPSCT